MTSYLIWYANILLAIVTILCSEACTVAKNELNQDIDGKRAELPKITTRNVDSGPSILELPMGDPIKAFCKKGSKESELDDYIENQNVAGLIVLHDGKIRMERYERDHEQTNLWPSLSVAKSVTSTLLGCAIKDGFINSVDDFVVDYLPDLKESAFDSVKIKHLLTMTSGVRWNEKYDDPDSDIARFSNDTTNDNMKAIVSYMRRLPKLAEPGEKFNYSTGETHLLGALISSATKQSLSQYLASKIWTPYGMEATATWRLDRADQEMAGCCLQMRLRDFARFGQFAMENGVINGKSIVPDGWFKEASKIHVSLWPGGGYGYGWWIFNSYSYQAMGIHGQLIYVDTSRKLVIAINSEWPEADSNERQFALIKFINSITAEIDKEK